MRRMRAATLISSPWMRTALAPSSRKRPSVPCAWKPTSSTVALLCHSQRLRWWRMRPASHMPLAAMMMWKPVSFAIALLSSTVSVKRRCGELQQPVDVDIGLEAAGMLPEHFGGANGERRIEKDRRRRHLAALHQVDQIDDQLLGALDREGRNEQRAVGGVRVANLGGEMLAPRLAA